MVQTRHIPTERPAAARTAPYTFLRGCERHTQHVPHRDHPGARDERRLAPIVTMHNYFAEVHE